MSYEEKLESISLIANGDQSGNQYKFMAKGSSGIALNTTSGGQCVGVLQDKPTDTHVGAVAIKGVTKVVAGAAVADGADVMSDTAGRAITATGTGAYVQGQALEAATAAGQIIAMLIRPSGQLN